VGSRKSILLFTLYDKDEMADLSSAQRKVLKAMLDTEIKLRRSQKTSRKKASRAARRDLFSELVEGMHALTEAREGKRTLRTYRIEFKAPPKMTPAELVHVRTQFRLSRGLFATFLRTNPRTLENWEQGRARPNAQAALLITLVNSFPDMVERLPKV
jgi:putative transcriptional regulator